MGGGSPVLNQARPERPPPLSRSIQLPSLLELLAQQRILGRCERSAVSEGGKAPPPVGPLMSPFRAGLLWPRSSSHTSSLGGLTCTPRAGRLTCTPRASPAGGSRGPLLRASRTSTHKLARPHRRHVGDQETTAALLFKTMPPPHPQLIPCVFPRPVTS